MLLTTGPASPRTSARYGLRGQRIGEASNPGPPQWLKCALCTEPAPKAEAKRRCDLCVGNPRCAWWCEGCDDGSGNGTYFCTVCSDQAAATRANTTTTHQSNVSTTGAQPQPADKTSRCRLSKSTATLDCHVCQQCTTDVDLDRLLFACAACRTVLCAKCGTADSLGKCVIPALQPSCAEPPPLFGPADTPPVPPPPVPQPPASVHVTARTCATCLKPLAKRKTNQKNQMDPCKGHCNKPLGVRREYWVCPNACAQGGPLCPQCAGGRLAARSKATPALVTSTPATDSPVPHACPPPPTAPGPPAAGPKPDPNPLGGGRGLTDIADLVRNLPAALPGHTLSAYSKGPGTPLRHHPLVEPECGLDCAAGSGRS